jgi:hypothetical protein
LERALEGWITECVRARSSLYGKFSSRFAAYDIVEMERARSELEMHRAVCAFAITMPATPAVRSAVHGRSILAMRGQATHQNQ